jgi:uroporphyrinogen III methyltransferase / synthase
VVEVVSPLGGRGCVFGVDMARVALTRADGSDGDLAERLRAAGHDVVHCPLIAVEPLGDGPVDAGGYDWLVVTSRNGADELARRLASRPRRIAAVGPATAEALRSHGLPVDFVPGEASQDGLVRELPRPAGRVLLAAAEGARRLLVDEFGADFLPLYRTRELEPTEFPAADVVVLASGSAARAFARTGSAAKVVAIGPQTAAEAKAAGLDVAAEAARPDDDALVDAVGAAAR